jgi:hypothetical protein
VRGKSPHALDQIGRGRPCVCCVRSLLRRSAEVELAATTARDPDRST